MAFSNDESSCSGTSSSRANRRSRGVRGPNFQDHERKLLFQLARNYRSIIDNADNSRFMMSEKTKIWETIASLFNSAPEIQLSRSWQQLRDALYNTTLIYKRKGFVPGGLTVQDFNTDEPDLDDLVDIDDQQQIVLNELEKQLLLRLAEERFVILGNTTNFESAVKARRIAWSEIATVFNSSMKEGTNIHRKRGHLQMAYNAYKQTQASKQSAETDFEEIQSRSKKVPFIEPTIETIPAMDDEQQPVIIQNPAELGTVLMEVHSEKFIAEKRMHTKYSEAERRLLFTVVAEAKRWMAAENKKGDSTKKTLDWKWITAKFNAFGISTARSRNQLKTIYKNEGKRRHNCILKERFIPVRIDQPSSNDNNRNAQKTESVDVDYNSDAVSNASKPTATVRSNPGRYKYSPLEVSALFSLVRMAKRSLKKLESPSKYLNWQLITLRFNKAMVSAVPRTKDELNALYRNEVKKRKVKKAEGAATRLQIDEHSSDDLLDSTFDINTDFTPSKHDDSCDQNGVNSLTVEPIKSNSTYNSSKFRKREIELILSLIEKFRTDQIQSKEKRATIDWAVIHSQYASAGISEVPRTKDQIQHLYKNMRASDRFRKHGSTVGDTSGSPPSARLESPVIEDDVELTVKCPSHVYRRWVEQKELGGFEDDVSFLDHLLLNEELQQIQQGSTAESQLLSPVCDNNALLDEEFVSEVKVNCAFGDATRPLPDECYSDPDLMPSKRIKCELATSEPACDNPVKVEPMSNDYVIESSFGNDVTEQNFENDVIASSSCGKNKMAVDDSNGNSNCQIDENTILQSSIKGNGFCKKQKQYSNAIGPGERAVCDKCGSSFRNSNSLRAHMATHGIGARLYKCSFCRMFMQSKASLREHRLIHTKEKPFICQHCSKSYGSKAALNGHIRKTHSRENLLYCSQCPRGFASTTELRCHENRHSGGSHKCPVCGYGFVSECQVMRHKFRKHGLGSMYICDCGSDFAYRTHYERHLTVHHPDFTEEQRVMKLDQPAMGYNDAGDGN